MIYFSYFESIPGFIHPIPAGNIIAFLFFLSRPKDLANRLYIIIAFVDILTSFCILPVGLSLLFNRAPLMFRSSVFCHIWGMVWTLTPYMSVFLVAVLSVSRTLVLMSPLRFRSIRVDIIMGFIAVYSVVIVVRSCLPYLVPFVETFTFEAEDMECMWSINKTKHSEDLSYTYNSWIIGSVLIQLTLPFLLIMVSCCLSVWAVRKSMSTSDGGGAPPSLCAAKRSATVTILIITLVYMTCNMPLFIYFIAFSEFWYAGDITNWIFSDSTDKYMWSFVYTTAIAVNAALNCVVYVCRMRAFRVHVLKLMNSLLFCKSNGGVMTCSVPDFSLSPIVRRSPKVRG